MGKVLWSIMIFIIMIIVMTIVMIYFLSGRKDEVKPTLTYADIRPTLKTGDIIFFVCFDHEDKIGEMLYYCRTKLINSEYGHVGIVMRDGDKLYLIDCSDTNHSGEKYAIYLNNRKQGGVKIIDLDIMIREYYNDNGGVFGVRYISREIINSSMITSIIKHKDKIYESKTFLSIMMFIDVILSHNIASKLVDRFVDYNKIYCSEMVYCILHDCGIVKEYPCKLFWPHLFNSNTFDDLLLVDYSDVIKFAYI